MGILDDLAAHDIIDRERDLALTTTERERDDVKQLLTDEQLAHADTRATLEGTRLSLAAVTAERDLLQQRVTFCEANHVAPPDPGPTKAELRAAWNICTHPNFQSKPAWENPDEWMAEVAAIGYGSIRGMFNPGLPNCIRTLELCRQYGITWLMTLAPGDGTVTPTKVESRIKWLADNGWSDVVLAFEGPNEPEAAGATTWVPVTLGICQAIKRGRDAHFPDKLILSPSMHDIHEDNSNGAGYKALAEVGIAELVDRISLHSYPKGQSVLTGFDDRLALARLAYPADMKVWLTETGWTTYPQRPDGIRGPQPTTEEDAAVFGSEAPAIIASHPLIEKAFRYEGRDDPVDMAPLMNDARAEARYGVIRDDKTWKPEATKTQAVLA